MGSHKSWLRTTVLMHPRAEQHNCIITKYNEGTKEECEGEAEGESEGNKLTITSIIITSPITYIAEVTRPYKPEKSQIAKLI